MSSKGNSRHIKRLAVSSYSKVGRKTAAYLMKPRPGRHNLENSIALLVLVRDKLGFASNAKEAKRIIRTGAIEVNSKIILDEKYPIGFGDLIKLKPTGEAYSIGVGRKGVIKLEKAEKKDAARTLKVVGKHAATGNKIMVRLLDGSVMQASNDIKVNDSIVIEKKGAAKTLRFEPGAKCLVIKGTHASEIGTIKEISKGSAMRVSTVKIEGSDATVFETLADNIMIVGA